MHWVMLRHIEFLTLFSLIREFVDFQISLPLKNFLLFSSKRFPSQYTACMLNHVQLYDLVDCSLPGSSVHGIFEAKILEFVDISFSISILRAWFYSMIATFTMFSFSYWCLLLLLLLSHFSHGVYLKSI